MKEIRWQILYTVDGDDGELRKGGSLVLALTAGEALAAIPTEIRERNMKLISVLPAEDQEEATDVRSRLREDELP